MIITELINHIDNTALNAMRKAWDAERAGKLAARAAKS